ncbi:MAG: serine hydrolase [Anaerolineae bacterium]|nr:serine hydrolase [Anaerolineae bacterium]
MSFAESLDSLFAEWDKPDSPGCALSVVQHGRITYARGYGRAHLEYAVPITPASVFHIASISKQFTALAIALLEQDGRLAYDDDVRQYLPELPDYGARITLRHLANHTSGLRDQWDLLFLAGWREEDLKTNADVLYLACRQQTLNFAPGAEFLYSNTGYTLLALIVERVSGLSFRAFTHDRIFAPLGMTHTHFHDDHSEIVPGRAYGYLPRPGGGFRVSIPNFDTIGASSLFTTVEDLALWANNYADPRVGGQAVIEQMLTPGVLNDGTVLDYALGVSVAPYRGARAFGHSGADAGYRSDFVAFPEHDLAIILFCNLGTMNPKLLTRQVADVLLAEHLTPTNQAAAVNVDTALLKANVGLYRDVNSLETRQIDLRDSGLVIPYVPGFDIPLTPLGPDRFVAAGWGFEVQFVAAPRRLEVYAESGIGRPKVYTAIDPAQPTADTLAEYVGTYQSAELDTHYTVELDGERLLLAHPKHGKLALTPTVTDGFLAASPDARADLLFTRDTTGQMSGFDLCTGRVRQQHFMRRK